MSAESDIEEFDITEAVKDLNREFQEGADHGGFRCDGTAGFHALFDHDSGIRHAGETALHAAISEVWQEVHVDPRLVEDNHGKVSPRTMADELEEQLKAFTLLDDRTIEQICDEFLDKLHGYEEQLSYEGGQA